MHWLCRIFGHKHGRKEGNEKGYLHEYCFRCGKACPDEKSAEYSGKWVLRCKVFGHKHRAYIGYADYDFDGWTNIYAISSRYCFACHFVSPK